MLECCSLKYQGMLSGLWWYQCTLVLQWQRRLSYPQGCHRWENQSSNQPWLGHVGLGNSPNPFQGFPLDELLRSVVLEVWASCCCAFGTHCIFGPSYWCHLVSSANTQCVLHVGSLWWELDAHRSGDWSSWSHAFRDLINCSIADQEWPCASIWSHSTQGIERPHTCSVPVKQKKRIISFNCLQKCAPTIITM